MFCRSIFCRSIVFALLAAGLLVAGPSMSVAGNFYLGLEIASSHIGDGDLSDEEIQAGALVVEEVGGGGGGYLGYAFSPAFSLRLRVTGTSHETSDVETEFLLVNSALEGIYKFNAKGPLSPYILGGLGGCTMTSRYEALEFDTTGGAVSIGFGAFYMLTEHLGLDFSCTGSFINWEEQTTRLTLPNGTVVEGTTSVDGSGATARFSLGIGYWF